LHVRQLHRAAAARLERIRSRPGDGTVGEKILLSLLAYHDARAGAPAAAAVPLARRALAGGTLIRAEMSSAAFVPPCLVLAMADLDDALAVYDDALTEARRRGSIITFATTKTFRAQTYVLRGDLAEAEAEGREAFAAAEAWGTTTRASVYLAAILAEALMEQGKLDEAAAALERSALGESLPKDARLLFLANIRARLRMLKGALASGLEDMLATGGRAARRSQPGLHGLALASRPRTAPARRPGRGPPPGGGRARAGAHLACSPSARRGAAGSGTGRRGRAWPRASRGGGRGAHQRPGEARAREGAHRTGGGASQGQPPFRGARAAAPRGRTGNDLRCPATGGTRRHRASRHRGAATAHRP